ncbi:hypothetical protein PP182_17450 [Maribacter sp. PR1]|uniref:Outer membrane protein beta-barrel domain-containing protein n=1 Tax=Maribacter cobaltidurans TaxID=1178778 RepID=A0ABU7IZ85_9FLAO|nr:MULTISPECIES: hypothetical protein [Maribacter]MDC6390479.1 hypothetical protein [Maribacter sp. PR1]MEE1977868.1 hypothetical protein [Maribacter cobaltidurans]
MNNQKTTALLLFLLFGILGFSQDHEENYITFNDRKNVVHGVYLGLSTYFGEIDDKDTYIGGLKVAYVANRQFEVGFMANVLYSEQDVFNPRNRSNDDIVAIYGGLHLEPILFGKSKVSLSFPVLIGGGGVGYVNHDAIVQEEDVDLTEDDIDAVFILEPGMNVLFNISRYVQLEAGVRYRFSSEIELADSPLDRINGFSGGIGVKLGVFNMGRNRYKKKLD